MHINLLPILLSASAVAALPNILNRAGGPVAKPIPENCSIDSIAPAGDASAFSVTPNFLTVNHVYSYFLVQDQLEGQQDFRLRQCLEQCNGFGGGCTSVLWAHNVDYVVRGSPGTGTACLFMHTDITQGDLAPVTNGSYVDAKALVINCP